MCTNVYNRLIYASKEMETNRKSFESEWINKLWYIHTMEYCSVIKRNEHETQMNLKILRQTERRKSIYDSIYIEV